MSPIVGSQKGDITEAVESLIAQLYSQGKKFTTKCKNIKKNLTQKQSFKSK
jgi:hypothetical protein